MDSNFIAEKHIRLFFWANLGRSFNFGGSS